MATVTEDLRAEGLELLGQGDAEEIHKFADRIVSVEPDNWYGLFVRGCGYALEGDFPNCIKNIGSSIGNADEATTAELCPMVVKYITECILRINTAGGLDFATVAPVILDINDKLPESDDEVVVSGILDGIEAGIREGRAASPLTCYYTAKALAVTSMRAYVELDLFVGFLEKLTSIGAAVKSVSDEKVSAAIDLNQPFIDELTAAIAQATSGRSGEELDAYEEYWLEHKVDPYLGHLLQAYQMSAGVASGRKFLGKMAGKLMTAEINNFVNFYFSAKIE